MSYYDRHESPQAEKLFRKFIQKYRDHKWTGKAYEKLGDVYTDMMQDKKAVDAYSHAADVARSPLDGVHSFHKLGNAYLKIGNETRAIEAFQKGIVLGERKGITSRPVPDSYYQIADCYYKKKNFPKALDYYKKASQKYFTHPDTPWGLFQIASIYKNTRKYDKAIKTFNKLINEYPDDYWARQAQWKLEDAIWEYEYRAVLK
jgi:TolA-binding protein